MDDEITIRPPHWRDVVELAACMRRADLDELHACGHHDALAVVVRGVRESAWSRAALGGGAVLCVFGVAPLRPHLLLETVGVPWLLATDRLLEHRRKLISEAPAYIERMLCAFPRLVNHVHADNRRAVRWLRRLGFTLAPAAPYGVNGEMFHQFDMTRHV